MRLGLRLGFNRQGGTAMPAEPAPTQAETTALLARMTTQPSSARATKINELIYALKQAGAWDKMARLYVLSAHDAQAAQRNWKADEDNIEVYGTVTFTEDLGYVSDGVTGSYLLTNYNPTTDGGMTAGNAHLGGVIDHLGATSTAYDIGIVTTSNSLRVRSTSAAGSLHGTPSGGVGSPPAGQHFAVSRTGPSSIIPYLDGVAGVEVTTAITPALPNGPLTLCALNSTSAPSTRLMRIAHVGAALSAAEAAAINTAFKAYLA